MGPCHKTLLDSKVIRDKMQRWKPNEMIIRFHQHKSSSRQVKEMNSSSTVASVSLDLDATMKTPSVKLRFNISNNGNCKIYFEYVL